LSGEVLFPIRSSLPGSAPFRKEYPLIVSSSTEKAGLFQRAISLRAKRHRLRFLKRINRSRVKAAAIPQESRIVRTQLVYQL
jgi:hypothetical protein